jgi:hypothetical protein
MVHSNDLSDKTVEDILINSDSEEGFGSDSDSDNQCESHSVSEAED